MRDRLLGLHARGARDRMIRAGLHTLVVVAPPSVPMAPIDAAARVVANSSQTPTGDASKSTGKRKTMEQQTELSTTCPVCKHTAGHNGGSIVTAPCCEKQLYCRACVTDLITKGKATAARTSSGGRT